MTKRVNSLPNDKSLDLSKLKAFADDEINVVQNLKFVDCRVENFVGKGENAGYHNVFKSPSHQGLLKVGIVR